MAQCSSALIKQVQQASQPISQQEALQGYRALQYAAPQGIKNSKVIQADCLTPHQLQLLQLEAQAANSLHPKARGSPSAMTKLVG